MNRLSPETQSHLREALSQWIGNDGSGDSTLAPALHAVASEARDRGLRAEEVLVILKTTWFEMGGGAGVATLHGSGTRRLDELVTACIKAYYG